MGCGGGVRAAGSALAVRPRSSLLTRQSVRKPRTHCCHARRPRVLNRGAGWGGAGGAFSSRFFGTAFSVCFRRESSPWFANFGVLDEPSFRGLFSPRLISGKRSDIRSVVIFALPGQHVTLCGVCSSPRVKGQWGPSKMNFLLGNPRFVGVQSSQKYSRPRRHHVVTKRNRPWRSTA